MNEIPLITGVVASVLFLFFAAYYMGINARESWKTIDIEEGTAYTILTVALPSLGLRILYWMVPLLNGKELFATLLGLALFAFLLGLTYVFGRKDPESRKKWQVLIVLAVSLLVIALTIVLFSYYLGISILGEPLQH